MFRIFVFHLFLLYFFHTLVSLVIEIYNILRSIFVGIHSLHFNTPFKKRNIERDDVNRHVKAPNRMNYFFFLSDNELYYFKWQRDLSQKTILNGIQHDPLLLNSIRPHSKILLVCTNVISHAKGALWLLVQAIEESTNCFLHPKVDFSCE